MSHQMTHLQLESPSRKDMNSSSIASSSSSHCSTAAPGTPTTATTPASSTHLHQCEHDMSLTEEDYHGKIRVCMCQSKLAHLGLYSLSEEDVVDREGLLSVTQASSQSIQTGKSVKKQTNHDFIQAGSALKLIK